MNTKYKKKLDRICSNRFEPGLSEEEFEKHLNDVYAWIICEWQCGEIETEDISPLKQFARDTAEYYHNS